VGDLLERARHKYEQIQESNAWLNRIFEDGAGLG
jgi:hypothetical protein